MHGPLFRLGIKTMRKNMQFSTDRCKIQLNHIFDKLLGSVYWQTAMVCQLEVIGRPSTKYMNSLPITSNWQTPDKLTKRTNITAVYNRLRQCSRNLAARQWYELLHCNSMIFSDQSSDKMVLIIVINFLTSFIRWEVSRGMLQHDGVHDRDLLLDHY